MANLIEHRRAFPTQAYMLIYIREDERDQILSEPLLDSIPSRIKDLFTTENVLLKEMQRDLEIDQDYGTIYLITPEIKTTKE